ncbi:MAG: hypothetical protein ACQKBW_03670, partial [Puniceicoccales bacterium]
LAAFIVAISSVRAEHPFMVVTESEYANLQDLANYEPWASMKSHAIEKANTMTYSTAANYRTRAGYLARIMSCNALAYILDPANRATYRAKIIDHMQYWDTSVAANLRDELNTTTWDDTVPVGAAFMNSVLALDIIYDDLTSTQISYIEGLLDSVGESYYACPNTAWKLSGYACRGIWAIYTGNTIERAAAIAGYREVMEGHLTDDGVFIDGPGYAAARLTSYGREQKHFFMDILEYQGLDSWYTEEKVINAFEWVAGYAQAPSGHRWVICDSSYGTSTGTDTSWATGFNRSTALSATAASYARNLQPDEDIPGMLSGYLTLYSQRPPARDPRSRLFMDGGAFFKDRSNTNQALGGVLWNCTRSGGHSRFEVNSVSLVGYGAYLLGNSGYAGWDDPVLGYSWTYLKHRAVSANTVLFDYTVVDDYTPTIVNNHVHKFGSGLSAGFTAPGFDLAQGVAGPAIDNGEHVRNFGFIHPQDGIDGYFVTWDQVVNNTPGGAANVVFHPYSDTYSTITTAQEYQWSIDGDNNPKLTVFLATPPDSVEFHGGGFASYSAAIALEGQYIKSNYSTSTSDGSGNIVTVLYPSDDSHAKPTITRLTGTGYTGAQISHSATVLDYVVEASSAASSVTVGGVTLEADNALYRMSYGALDWFYADGLSLSDNASSPIGFTSDHPAIVYIKDGVGTLILQDDSTMTVSFPGATGVQIDGEPVEALALGDGTFKFEIAAGTHSIALPSGAPASLIIDDGNAGYSDSGGFLISQYSGTGYDGDYRHDQNTGGNPERWAIWYPASAGTPVAGVYTVSMYWKAASNRASNATVRIYHQNGAISDTSGEYDEFIVDQTEGSSSGTWTQIGDSFVMDASDFVQILNTGADGYVLADAVKFELQ